MITKAIYDNRKRILWEMPAGHGKSYLMLFLTALLLTWTKVEEVVLVYHEEEIMAAERAHTDIMIDKFKRVKVSTLKKEY